MYCRSFWKRIIPFALALGLGLLAANILRRENFAENGQEKYSAKVVYSEKGTGISGGSDIGTGLPPFYNEKSSKASSSETKTLQIVSKPRAIYTDAARQNQIQGKVRLRVTFLASGQIGDVSPISNLPDGLTEQAITAAKQIKFKPEIRNGKPIPAIKIVEYNFTIY